MPSAEDAKKRETQKKREAAREVIDVLHEMATLLVSMLLFGLSFYLEWNRIHI